MSPFRSLYESDIARYEGDVPLWNRQFHYYLRRLQTCRSRILRLWHHIRFRALSESHRMEISAGAAIGKGFCLTDPYAVTINSNAVIGEDVTLGRNVTIGKQNRGKREGTPVIGDRVTIGHNAVIVGKITIGNDVTIAPNAYVNRDIPDGSDVIGNPCIIREREG